MATLDTELPPPLHDIPKAKEKKYDRQLRLWGASGQVALEETHVLLINSSSGPGVTGVETLKNLVLPGVGQFTILDSAVVSEADLGVNFFLEDASLGKFRAAETARLLMELNPGVQGHAVTEPLETWMEDEEVWKPYNLILAAAPIDAVVLERIQTQAQKRHTPAFYYHCVGYHASFSLLLPPAFPIVDTHPDPTATTDLRLLKPWPALSDFAKEKTAGLEEGTMSAADKAHIPWVCLLLHCLEEWKTSHDGKAPDNYKDKSAFRDLVRAGDANEENFDEAYAAVLKSLNPPTAPSSVRDIFAAPEAQKLTADTPPFWLIANAVSTFYNTHGQLPLPGAVPDMKAQSADYIQLQNIYKSKARADSSEVLATVRSLEQSTARSPKLKVDEKDIENFCKGSAHISLVRGRPFQIAQQDREVNFGDRAKAMAGELTMPDSLIGLHLAFLAWDTFIASHSTPASDTGGQGLRIPGASSSSSSYDADTRTVTGIAHKLLDALITEAGSFVEEPEYSECKTRVEGYVVEIVRAGGGELHNIASLVGGLLGQEVIKVVTRQYVPVEGTCLVDGVGSRTQVLRV